MYVIVDIFFTIDWLNLGINPFLSVLYSYYSFFMLIAWEKNTQKKNVASWCILI